MARERIKPFPTQLLPYTNYQQVTPLFRVRGYNFRVQFAKLC